jgi:hypothetical protein
LDEVERLVTPSEARTNGPSMTPSAMWLEADLALRARQLETDIDAAREADRRRPVSGKTDSTLAGVRDAAELAKRPAPERDDWQVQWADVDALLAKADVGYL